MGAKSQVTDQLFMIRPVNFGFNAETAVNNGFQVDNGETWTKTQEAACEEFDEFVKILRAHKINVTVVNDTPSPHTPDSIFPNNIYSYHEDGTVCIYPVFAQNRRTERKPMVLAEIQKYFKLKATVDLTHYEGHNKFLEGTGSLILDRVNLNVFACLSPRTNPEVVAEFARTMGYTGKIIIFTATDEKGGQIYHTNVMMSIGEGFAVVCTEAIPSAQERNHLLNILANSGKEIIEITMDQMNSFAGNVLQVKNRDVDRILVMSTRAYNSLTQDQIIRLQVYNKKIIHAKLNTIENCGGGSARCMLAEIFLPLKE